MRRGLMAWDPDELPRAVLDDRLARLRGMMRQEELDAFLIYTNLVRPSAVTWLTGFTPYWSEGALLVLEDGAPIFSTALSKRVANWIRTTNPVSEVVNSPRPGTLLGERLVAHGGIRRLGVLELDALPSGLSGDLTSAAPSIELVDATAPFAGIRRTVDDAERRLLVRADALAAAALDHVAAEPADDAGVIAGLAEKHARLAGAEEAHIAVAADLDADRRLRRIVKATPLGARFAVRASIAYKGVWVRRIRTFARDEAGRRAIARADRWFDDICGTIDPGKELRSQLEMRSRALTGEAPQPWLAECCLGSYPLQVVATSDGPAMPGPPFGDLVILTLSLTIDGIPWLGAAPIRHR